MKIFTKSRLKKLVSLFITFMILVSLVLTPLIIIIDVILG
ncbi:MAG: hypothetical protein KatS3mg085_410 [Candidatus Dojkabacteria bacterium]|nr:MAG: hypothetical protein KatS3mg085_410 [Candidatus Dojkabacteria bacterium]